MDRTGACYRLDRPDIRFGYRSSQFLDEESIVLSAEFELKPCDQSQVKQRIQDYVQQRLEKQPLRRHTCGSVFKNPPHHTAGQLIERAGLKGYQMGRVMVSDQHANFIENLGEASYSEVTDLILYIKQTVMQKTFIELETEVQFLS